MRYELIAENIYDNLLEQVLVNRGIPHEECQHYLRTTDDDIIDPSTIANIKEGAELLAKHIKANNKIFIQVDSDVDGFTSSSILINYIHRHFPDFAENNIVYRVHENKAHGLIPETIPEDVALVIAPDSSSEQPEIHKQIKEMGKDILIIDHHNAEFVSPYAVVINNQLCDYPNKTLSGAGMVWKFCCYLDEVTGKDCAQDYLDLAICGIIADVMDIRNMETRRLIDKGAIHINNEFLKEIIERNSFRSSATVTPKTFAWSVAPSVNAITRVGTVEEKMLVFEAFLDFKALEEIPSTKRGHAPGEKEFRVAQAVRTCTNVKRHQDDDSKEIAAMMEEVIEEKHLLDNKILALKMKESNETIRNITGLSAMKLAAKYQRPVLILSPVTDEDGKLHWSGSGRNGGAALDSLQQFLKDSNMVDFASGHDNAFGISIPDDKFNDLIEYSNDKLKDADFTPKYSVDKIYKANNVDLTEILSIASYENLWGQCVDEPLVAFEGVTVQGSDIELLGKKMDTLKINLGSLSFIKFGVSQEEYDALLPVAGGRTTINFVGTCARNDYNDLPQIKIVDYEVVSKQNYVF